MKKLLLIVTGALLLSACSSSNQISITHSRYGNGVGISFGNNGMSDAEIAKAERFRQAAHERVEHQKFVRGLTAIQRTPQVLISDLDLTMAPVEVNQALIALTAPQTNVAEAPIASASVVSKNIQNQMNADVPEGAKEQSKIKTATAVKKAKKNGWSAAEVSTILLVILSFFIPPLAVFLYEGEWTNRVLLNIILTLLCGIPGVIHALIVILGNK